ncbi:MAG: (2Fe-2S)-binding protein [Gammaproteobacteria bacterium]|nr:(2Fe-2S)-binding protein [Gammaproteobacteria bacterium]
MSAHKVIDPMYICVCHLVTDKDIHRAVERGVESLSQLSEALPLGNGCGACLEYAKGCLDAALQTGLREGRSSERTVHRAI